MIKKKKTKQTKLCIELQSIKLKNKEFNMISMHPDSRQFSETLSKVIPSNCICQSAIACLSNFILVLRFYLQNFWLKIQPISFFK